MKKSPFFSGFLLLAGLLTAHAVLGQASITGTLQNNDQQVLSFANVLLKQQTDSALVKGAIAQESGAFELERVPPGDYFIYIRMIGYEPFYSNAIHLSADQSTFSVGTLRLQTAVVSLEQVEIVAEKPMFEQQIDRLIVNVQNSITAAGGSALDILERSPGIILDRQNNSLSMNGKQGVIVMLNGKRNRMPLDAVIQLLDGMNADNIEKIELITTPPARFDAEGDAGIINIVMKKNLDYGLNGSFSLNAGYGVHDKQGGSINMNYRKNKLNLFGDYSINRNHLNHDFHYTRRVIFEGNENELIGDSDRDPTQFNQNIRIGADYEVSKKTVIGGIVSGYKNVWSMTALNPIEYLTNGIPTRYELLNTQETNTWQHIMGNLNLTHQFDKSQKLSVDVDYLRYHNANPSDYQSEVMDGEKNFIENEDFRVRKETPLDVYVAKIDYSKQISEKVSIETGIKGTASRFINDISVENLEAADWVINPEFSNIFDLEEDIAAAYGSVNAKLSKKITLQAGLRYEYTRTNLGAMGQPDVVDRKYGNLFPSLFLSRDINEHNRVQFSYSRRIARPTFNEMAPFVMFFDPNTFMGGNANLRPAITDALKLDYRFKTLFLSLSYSHDTDAIARFQPRIDPEDNSQIMYSDNIDSRNTYNLMIAYPLKITDWWQTQTNLIGTIQSQNTLFEGQQLQSNQRSVSLNGSHKFQLPAEFAFEISGFYRSPVLFGVFRMKSMGAVNAGLQKKLRKNGGTFNLSIQDIFWTRKMRFEGDQPEINLDIAGRMLFEPRVIRLTYSHNFGNKKVKASRNRKTGSDEERKRVE